MKYLTLVCLFLAGCGGAGAGSGKANLTSPTQNPTKLYVYGDQMTFLASNYAQSLATQEGYTIVVKSVAGSIITSANQYTALMTDTWEANAVVMWDFGNNEAAVSGAVNAAYKTDIANVSARLIGLNQKAILGGPSPYCNDGLHNPQNANVSSFWTNNVYPAWQVNDPTLSWKNFVYYRIGSGNLGVGAFVPTAGNTAGDCVTPNAAGFLQTFTDLLANWQYDITSSGGQVWSY